MHDYQTNFIELALAHHALCFGEFTLKSGRTSPYFFNAGRFYTGSAMVAVGQCYAQALVGSGIAIDALFGPAYKGIPLATTSAMALSQCHGLDYPVSYNRKESKAHGEGGSVVGAPLSNSSGRVAIVDDVITAGTAIRQAIGLIREAGAQPAAVVVGLDRQEKGEGERSAIEEIEQTYGIPVISIIKLVHIIEYVEAGGDAALMQSMRDYRKAYGV